MSSTVVHLPNLNGCAVDNRYYLRKLIGTGTFGVVYQAVDLRASPTEDPYRAVKVIPKVGRQPHEIAMFHREVAFHAVVSHHPNIVGLRDVYEDDEYLCIVLDYHSGGDMYEQICQGQMYMYNDNLLRTAFVSLIDAVQACHDAGIAHRDLKPENVLLSKDGSQTYLADFGIATNEHIVDSFGCGTLQYMAPECAGPQPYCAPSNDIWGLGVILVNMIGSMNPWEEASVKDKGFARFCEDPKFLYDSLPISEGAYAILLSIFTLPLRRISLPMLRKMVLEVDTFFRAPTATMAAVDIPNKKYAEAYHQQQPQPQVYAQPYQYAYQEPDCTKESYFTPPALEHMHPAARKEESYYISTDSSSYSPLSSTGAWSADTIYSAPVADAASADPSSHTTTFLSPRAMEARWLEDYDRMAEKFREHYYPSTPSDQPVVV